MSNYTEGGRRQALVGWAGHRRGRRAAAVAAVLAMLATAGCGPDVLSSGSSALQSASSSSDSGAGAGSGAGHGSTMSAPTASAPANSGGQATGTGSRSGVLDGALFGGDVPLVPESGKLGRNLAIVRMYFFLGEKFPTASADDAMRKGSTLLVSLDLDPLKGPGFASIASGQHDAFIKQFLKNLDQAAVHYHLGAIYFCFEHEANAADDHRSLGTSSQFVQAWDHIHALATSAHLLWNDGGRMHFVVILTSMSYQPMKTRPAWARSAGAASSYFPGKNEVDIVGVDGYNTSGCRHVTKHVPAMPGNAAAAAPSSLYGPAISFARSEGNLPVFIAEWGSVAYVGNSKQASFITQMHAFVAANHEIAAALYWDSWNPAHPACIMVINDHPTSLSTLAVMGHSAPLQGHLVRPPATG